jgi:S-adenosylmethionine-diacylgycerolhomoserine-N-methlytransferase
MDASHQALHRAFLNRRYGLSRFVYDATRKYYLFGRDGTLRDLLAEPWESLVEVGAGTGRNLRMLHRRRPGAVYGGVEPCDEMREHARPRVPWVRLVDAFAEEVDYTAILGRSPDRILFSYSLSMVGDPQAALRRAIDALAPSGAVVVVDFGDLAGFPAAVRGPFRKFLSAFHVKPLDLSALKVEPHDLRVGPWGYYLAARFTPRM